MVEIYFPAVHPSEKDPVGYAKVYINPNGCESPLPEQPFFVKNVVTAWNILFKDDPDTPVRICWTPTKVIATNDDTQSPNSKNKYQDSATWQGVSANLATLLAIAHHKAPFLSKQLGTDVVWATGSLNRTGGLEAVENIQSKVDLFLSFCEKNNKNALFVLPIEHRLEIAALHNDSKYKNAFLHYQFEPTKTRLANLDKPILLLLKPEQIKDFIYWAQKKYFLHSLNKTNWLGYTGWLVACLTLIFSILIYLPTSNPIKVRAFQALGIPLIPIATSLDKPLTIRIGVGSSPGEHVKRVLELYEDAINYHHCGAPDCYINLDIETFANYSETLVRLQENSYDLILLDDPWVPEFSARKMLVNLNTLPGFKKFEKQYSSKQKQLFSDVYYKSLQNACEYNGKLYGLPLVGNVHMLLYNGWLLEQYKNNKVAIAIPEPGSSDFLMKLSEAIDTIEKEKRHIANPPDNIFALRDDHYNDSVEQFFELYQSFEAARSQNLDGLYTVNNGKQLVLNRASAQEAHQWMKRHGLNSNKGLHKKDEVKDAIKTKTDTLFMTFGWPTWVAPFVLSGSYINSEHFRFQRIAKWPVLGAWVFAIPVKTAGTESHYEEALSIAIALSTSPEIQFALAQRGVFPVISSPPWVEDVRKLPFWKFNFDQIQNAIKMARPRPRLERWKDFEDHLGAQLEGDELRSTEFLLLK